MTDIVERARRAISNPKYFAGPMMDIAAELADELERITKYADGLREELHGVAVKFAEEHAEVKRLHTWDGLMSLVDEHYPASIFPTGEDREDRDSGPRIISLLRRLSENESPR